MQGWLRRVSQRIGVVRGALDGSLDRFWDQMRSGFKAEESRLTRERDEAWDELARMKYGRRARLRSDPIGNVVEVFNRLFPGIEVAIDFVSGLKDAEDAWGVTHFPDDGGPPSISLDVDLEYRHVVEILAHELAHVAAPDDEDHGEKWEAAFSLIHAECSKDAEAAQAEDTP